MRPDSRRGADVRGNDHAKAPHRPLASGAVMGAASRVVVAACGAVATVVLARVLGPDGAGSYFVAQSLVVVLGVATTLGIEHGITYYVSSGEWGPRDAYRSAARVAIALGMVGIAVGLVVRIAFPSAFAGLSLTLTAVAASALPFVLLWLYANSVALATDRYEVYALLPSLQALLMVALTALGAVVVGLSGAVAGTAIAAAIVGIGAGIWGLRLPRARTERRGGQLRKAAVFGIKGYAGNALQILNYRLDLFILAAVATNASVGEYGLAVAATSVLWLLPTAIADVLFPRVAQLGGSDDQGSRAMAEVKSLRHASFIVYVTAAGLVIALEALVIPLYGVRFSPAINLGLILLPGAALVPLARILAATIVGRGNPNYPLIAAVLTTPVTLFLYVTLIPWLHATGAAIASTISYTATFIALAYFYRRVTGRKVLPSLVPTRSEFKDLLALTSHIAPKRAERPS